jgi:peptidylprolyl isomerase domain and WD repeat-containing protein 1
VRLPRASHARVQLTPRARRDEKSGERDIFNERPTLDERAVAAPTGPTRALPSPLASAATLHTTFGDIHVRLFPQQAPRAVENFVAHARAGYFEGVLFHRVIPKFMIQTGDPLGDGTGGESIWGREFEDEFSPDLRHDRCVHLPPGDAMRGC